MAEIDTRPLESVREAVTLFDPRSDRFSPAPDRNEEEIVVLTKELATSKLQLEVKENETKQAVLKLETLQKAMQELSERYDRACLDSRARISHLEAENGTVRSRHAETAEECRALRDELAVVRGELHAAKASVAVVLTEVEAMEKRAVTERGRTKEALTQILLLNEAVLSSAVAAIRAEEERSVFFQEVTCELFNSDKNLEVIRRQTEMLQGMEKELLAKTVEIEYLRSELKQAKEKYIVISSREVPCAIADTGSCETSVVVDQEPEAEFTFQHVPEERFGSEIFKKDCQVVPSDGILKMPEDNVEDAQHAEVAVQDTTLCEGHPDAQEIVCLVDKISGEDHRDTQRDNQEPPEADGVMKNSKECEVNLLHDREEPKFDFQSVHSDDGNDISITMPEQVDGNQQPGAEAAAPTCTPHVSNDEDEFYTKEPEPDEQGGKLDGHVLVAKGAEADAAKVKLLDAARAEISDLRFSLEEAVRRAELAEEAKAALERELKEEIRNKHPSRRRAALDSEDARRVAGEGTTPTPGRARPAPPRSARPGGKDLPTPRCVTLGKVLNMKYK